MSEPWVEPVGHVERTYQLKLKDGRFAWIFTDSGEVLEDKLFPTQQAAEDWHQRRFGQDRLMFVTGPKQ